MLKILLAAGTAMGAAAVIAAAPAHADSETGFLNSLNAFGMVIYDSQMALDTGHWICTKLNSANGSDVAAQLYTNTNSDISTMADADAWVVAAVLNLCPWQYHPGRSNTTLT